MPETLEQFKADLERRRQERAFTRKVLLSEIEGAKGARFIASNGNEILVHPSPRKAAETDWQLTYMSDGQPSGHNNPPSFVEGCLRAAGVSEDGYWNDHGYELVEVIR